MIDTRTADYAALLLRVTLGITFLAHFALKAFVFGPAGTAAFFESLGLPGFLAYVTMVVEFVGALALIAGVGVRYASLVLALVLVGTIVTVHGKQGFFFSNPHGGWEYPAFWAIMLVVLALLGPGKWSVGRPA